MRELAATLESEFEKLSNRWISILENAEALSDEPVGRGQDLRNAAVHEVVRSASKVEQAFGGINSQLWDDPFEWTLPEVMNSFERIREYLDEADRARGTGMLRIKDDSDLLKIIVTPWGSGSLGSLLVSTLTEAVRFASRAEATILAVRDASTGRP